MSSLYSVLPPHTYTLNEFVLRAEALKAEDQDEFHQFILTGQVNGENGHQVVLDPIRNVLDDDHSISIARDYDSLLTFQSNIIVDCPISIYPIPNPVEVLTTSIHLQYPILKDNTSILTPVHQIPNFKFAFWNQRHMIHIFFPRLVDERRTSPKLSADQLGTFYVDCVRPSIATLLPENVSDWPASYDAEMFRARKRSGHVSYQTKMVHPWALALLPHTMRTQLTANGIDWAQDFFFLHTIRGTKHGTQHSWDAESAELALHEYLFDASIPLAATEEGIWWVDVAAEISSDEMACLQWRTSSHFHIVRDILEIPDHHAQRITSLGSSKYARDLVSHLTAVSGCRIEPGVQARGHFQAAYVQMYTTDKAITYNPEGIHHAKSMTIKDAMGQTQPPSFTTGLFGVYRDAVGNNSSNARVEVRVPLDFATSVLLGLNRHVIRDSLLSFTSAEWWNFRLYRLLGMSRVLSLQATGPAALRVRPEALLLTAASVWLINGLHARPDDGHASRNLMEAVLPITEASDADADMLAFPLRTHTGFEEEEEEEEEAAIIPYNPFGVVFLRCMKLNVTVPRMRAGGRFLSDSAFKFLFGATEEEVHYRYYSIGLIPPEATHKVRVITNKTRVTPTFVNFSAEPQPALFHLAEKGYTLPPPPQDDGSDIDTETEDDPNGNDIDLNISQMWRQFLIDMAVKTPVARGAASPSYLKLSADGRMSVGEDFYKIIMLSDIWRACQYKVASPEDWNLAFDHLFPPREHKTSAKVQNYRQCKYYIKWKEICATADEATVAGIRHQIKKKMNKLVWIPHACQDKLWPTATKAKFTRLPPNSTGPAPRILVKQKPTWQETHE